MDYNMDLLYLKYGPWKNMDGNMDGLYRKFGPVKNMGWIK